MNSARGGRGDSVALPEASSSRFTKKKCKNELAQFDSSILRAASLSPARTEIANRNSQDSFLTGFDAASFYFVSVRPFEQLNRGNGRSTAFRVPGVTRKACKHADQGAT